MTHHLIGTHLEILLKMDSKFFPNAISRNTVAEINGTADPDKIVLVSGHLDSWDVGEGAMDDGGGAFISWNSLVVLKNLGLRPKRTIRYDILYWSSFINIILFPRTFCNEQIQRCDKYCYYLIIYYIYLNLNDFMFLMH